MRTFLLFTYSIVLIICTAILSGHLFSLDEYCQFKFESSWSPIYILLFVLFIPCFTLEWIFRKKKYNGLGLIYGLPIILVFIFLFLDNKTEEQFFTDNPVIIDRAIIAKKTNSKFTWFAVAKFKLDNDSIKRQFEINGNLLKQKKIGDTILIKYIKDCPKICMHFNFSPSRDEIAYYIGGKLITPTSSMKDETPAPQSLPTSRNQ